MSISIMPSGGSGGGLLTSVVGGLEQPSSAKPGTIWISTETPIGKVTMDVTEPAEPGTGDVFVLLGTVSRVPIELDKKGMVMIYPVLAKQWDGTSWIVKDSCVYNGSDWVYLRTYIYNRGEEYTDVTGGWTATGYYGMNSKPLPLASFGETSVTVTGTDAYTGAGTQNKIQFTGMQTVTLKGTAAAASHAYAWASVLAQKSAIPNTQASASFVINDGAIGDGDFTWTIDVTSLEGEYYFSFGGVQCTYEVKEVYLT